MATLISFYKDNKITSSEVESKDIDIVLGFLFKDYVLGEDITENFDSKFLYIEDSKFKMKPLNKKIKTFSQEKEDSVEVLIQFEELAKGYEAAYIFDQYEVFKFENGDYKNLDELKAHYQRGGLGDMKVKRFLNNVLQAELAPIRERRQMWEKRPQDVYAILKSGSEVARAKAAETLAGVRRALEIEFFEGGSLFK